MAHLIHRMAFVGEVPWHGLGTPLPQNATYEEVIEAAGFYTVLERPVFVPGKLDAIPDVKALVRADTHDVLAVVGSRYEVVQSADVAKTLVEASSGVKAIFHTAGTLGRLVFDRNFRRVGIGDAAQCERQRATLARGR